MKKHITPFDWTKRQLIEAWNEEKALKEKIITERDVLRSALQQAEAKNRNLDDLRIREERRANIAEAAHARTLDALVIAVTRLGER